MDKANQTDVNVGVCDKCGEEFTEDVYLLWNRKVEKYDRTCDACLDKIEIKDLD